MCSFFNTVCGKIVVVHRSHRSFLWCFECRGQTTDNFNWLFYEQCLFKMALPNLNKTFALTVRVNLTVLRLGSQVYLTPKEWKKVAYQLGKKYSTIYKALGLRRTMITAIMSEWRLFGKVVNFTPSIPDVDIIFHIYRLQI